jgi:predicted  nucleic acid-binding Zn-ribbon protein
MPEARVQDLRILEAEIRIREQSLMQREGSLLLSQRQLDEATEKFRVFMDSEHVRHNREILETQKQLEDLKEQVKPLQESIATLTVRAEDLVSQIGRLNRERTDAEKALLLIEEEATIAKRNLSTHRNEERKEKTRIQKEIEGEKNKIKKPLELLAKERAELERKQRNFDILVARFRKNFTKWFPGQELKL